MMRKIGHHPKESVRFECLNIRLRQEWIRCVSAGQILQMFESHFPSIIEIPFPIKMHYIQLTLEECLSYVDHWTRASRQSWSLEWNVRFTCIGLSLHVCPNLRFFSLQLLSSNFEAAGRKLAGAGKHPFFDFLHVNIVWCYGDSTRASLTVESIEMRRTLYDDRRIRALTAFQWISRLPRGHAICKLLSALSFFLCGVVFH